MATFNSPTDVTAGSLAKSSDLNNIDAAVAAAFALLPTNASINAGTVNYAADTGIADVYAVALPMTATSYTDGLVVIMKPLYANTGACTLNVDSLGAKSIKTEANGTPAAGDIVAGVPIELRYSSTTGFFHIIKNSAAQATAAAASAAAAAVSAAAALVSQNAAAGSASSASTSAGTATTQALASAASAAAALVSQNAASGSAVAALASQGAASGSAAAALVSENAASGSASTATTQASNASISAAAAFVSQNLAEAAWDNLDDRYLGAKSSDPVVDNDGNALITGAMYFNTVSSGMKVYSGTAWLVIGASEVAGDGIDVTFLGGTVTISANLKANGGLVIETGEIAVDLGASSITGTLAVGDGGTGRTTSTTAYGLIAAGTTATGALQTLPAGLTTQILVGGGASALPAWGTDLPTAVTIGTSYIYRAGGTDVPVSDGGTGASTFALNGVLYGNGTSAIGATAIGAEGQILRAGASPFVPAWTTATFPATTTINQILYSSAANTVTGLATGNSGVLVTSSGGVPSIATDIPTAVTIGSAYIYRAGGTDIPVADGGTGASTLTDHGILLGSGTGAITPLGVATNGQLPIGSTGADPVLAALTEGEAIDITNGAGTITIACEDASTTNKGVVELATVAETVAGTSTTLTPTCDGVAAAVAVLAREPDQGVAMTYAASGSSGITVADNDNIDFGTGNFTLVWKGSLPDWTPSAGNHQLFYKASGGGANYYGYTGIITTDGVLTLSLWRNDLSIPLASTANISAVDGTTHEIVIVVTRETASTAGSVVFYVNGYQLGASVAITAAATVTISNTGNLYWMGTPAIRTSSTNNSFITFNRALTAAEVLDLYRNGIAESDKWGSQTAVYTSDFSAGVDSWIGGESGLTLTGNTDGINGSDDWLKVERTGAAGRADISRITGFVTNKRGHATVTIYNDASSPITHFMVLHSNGDYKSPPIAVLAGTEVTVTAYVTTTGNGEAIYIFPCTAGGTNITSVATGAIYYVKEIITYESGATLALEPEGINETNWQDSSTNNLDATYPTTGWSLTRKVPTATTTEKGFAELATNAEALAGTDTARIITPDDLKYVLDRRIQQYYGVSWDESADTYVRTGSTAGQTCGVTLADAFLPVHRRMRGCLVADDGTVNYYLCATDWTKKEDGATASDLTGTDGQVMVEIPKFWYRYGYSGTTHTYEVSPVPLTGFKVHEMFMSDTTEKDYVYIGAYEASLYDVSASKYVGQCYQTSVSAVFATSDDSITIATRTGWATALAVGQKLVITGTSNNNTTVTVKTIESATKITVDENLTDETAATTVIQTETNVTDTTGDKLCSVSGVCPITGGSANGRRAHFRTWAENRGGGKATNDAATVQWSQLYGDAHSALQLLYLTEYASFNSQSVLGYGIAALSSATWAAYNDYNPIAKSGNGNVVGNASGNTATDAITTGAGATSVYLKYRGIENLYGHIWKFVDGFKVNDNIPYLCNNFANFSDAESTDNYTNPTDVNGVAITMHNADGYQGTLELTGRAFMPASLTGGSASAKITDSYYQASGWRVVTSGGDAYSAARDGAFYLVAYDVLAYVARFYGARLVLRK